MMIKPEMPNIPGLDAMGDTLDFVRKMWSGMQMPGAPGMPGMPMPTMSVEEINKQITDLRTVEAWLNMNMSMLRATIQALEVQSATLSTLQAMGDAFKASVQPENAPNFFTAPQAAAAPEAQAGGTDAPAPGAPGKPDDATEDPPPAAGTVPNPAAWWNMMQDQFRQAVDNAMAAGQAAPAAKKTADRPAAKTPAGKRKPRAKPAE
jgi:hypothetical protein